MNAEQMFEKLGYRKEIKGRYIWWFGNMMSRFNNIQFDTESKRFYIELETSFEQEIEIEFDVPVYQAIIQQLKELDEIITYEVPPATLYRILTLTETSGENSKAEINKILKEIIQKGENGK